MYMRQNIVSHFMSLCRFRRKMGLSLGAKSGRSDIFYPKRQYNVVLDLVYTNKLGDLDIFIFNLSEAISEDSGCLGIVVAASSASSSAAAAAAAAEAAAPAAAAAATAAAAAAVCCLVCEFFDVVNFTMFWPPATTSCGNLQLQTASLRPYNVAAFGPC